MFKKTKHIQILQWSRKKKWLNLNYGLLVLEGVLELSPDTRQDSLQEGKGIFQERRKHTLKMEASENMALWGNAMVQSGWRLGDGGVCEDPLGLLREPFTKGLVHHAQNLDFWVVGGDIDGKLFTWKSRHFCGYLLAVIFILCWKGIKLLFFSLIFYNTHPKVTLWTLLHSTLKHPCPR